MCVCVCVCVAAACVLAMTIASASGSTPDQLQFITANARRAAEELRAMRQTAQAPSAAIFASLESSGNSYEEEGDHSTTDGTPQDKKEDDGEGAARRDTHGTVSGPSPVASRRLEQEHPEASVRSIQRRIRSLKSINESMYTKNLRHDVDNGSNDRTTSSALSSQIIQKNVVKGLSALDALLQELFRVSGELQEQVVASTSSPPFGDTTITEQRTETGKASSTAVRTRTQRKSSGLKDSRLREKSKPASEQQQTTRASPSGVIMMSDADIARWTVSTPAWQKPEMSPDEQRRQRMSAKKKTPTRASPSTPDYATRGVQSTASRSGPSGEREHPRSRNFDPNILDTYFSPQAERELREGVMARLRAANELLDKQVQHVHHRVMEHNAKSEEAGSARAKVPVFKLRETAFPGFPTDASREQLSPQRKSSASASPTSKRSKSRTTTAKKGIDKPWSYGAGISPEIYRQRSPSLMNGINTKFRQQQQQQQQRHDTAGNISKTYRQQPSMTAFAIEKRATKNARDAPSLLGKTTNGLDNADVAYGNDTDSSVTTITARAQEQNTHEGTFLKLKLTDLLREEHTSSSRDENLILTPLGKSTFKEDDFLSVERFAHEPQTRLNPTEQSPHGHDAVRTDPVERGAAAAAELVPQNHALANAREKEHVKPKSPRKASVPVTSAIATKQHSRAATPRRESMPPSLGSPRKRPSVVSSSSPTKRSSLASSSGTTWGAREKRSSVPAVAMTTRLAGGAASTAQKEHSLNAGARTVEEESQKLRLKYERAGISIGKKREDANAPSPAVEKNEQAVEESDHQCEKPKIDTPPPPPPPPLEAETEEDDDDTEEDDDDEQTEEEDAQGDNEVSLNEKSSAVDRIDDFSDDDESSDKDLQVVSSSKATTVARTGDEDTTDEESDDEDALLAAATENLPDPKSDKEEQQQSMPSGTDNSDDMDDLDVGGGDAMYRKMKEAVATIQARTSPPSRSTPPTSSPSETAGGRRDDKSSPSLQRTPSSFGRQPSQRSAQETTYATPPSQTGNQNSGGGGGGLMSFFRGSCSPNSNVSKVMDKKLRSCLSAALPGAHTFGSAEILQRYASFIPSCVTKLVILEFLGMHPCV